MEQKFFRSAFGMKQVLTLAPAAVLAGVWVLFWTLGGAGPMTVTGAVLGLMVAFWLGLGLWRVLSEGCRLEKAALYLVSGPQKTAIRYESIYRVMAGDVTLPGSRMARGALLIEQEGAARGQIIYPRDMAALVAELKQRAPEAIFITDARELEAARRAAAGKKNAEK